MKMSLRCALLAFAVAGILPMALSAAQPWQEVTVPTVAQAAAAFPKPPAAYGAIYWATGYPPTKERILADIENLSNNGGSAYMINSGGRNVKYLSPEYFTLMDVSMEELRKRGFKMWIDGDDGYPDGFAAGMISKEYPQLTMQGIVVDARYTIAPGQTLTIQVPVDTLGIFANVRPPVIAPPAAPAPAAAPAAPATTPAAPAAPARAGAGAARGGRAGETVVVPGTQMLPVPANGTFKWTAPAGLWEVLFQGSPGEPRYTVVAGQTLTIPLPPDTKAIQASTRGAARGGGGARGGAGGGAAAATPTVIAVPADGKLSWTAPAGTMPWEVTFVRHVFRSSPTRYGQREDGTRDKDSLYSLIDYLNPEATAAYIKLVPETYEKHYGKDFGNTILGFRGDEPDYTGFVPWTGKLLETFQARKGYDLKPHIGEMFALPLTEEAKRVRADYFDVWSAMFRDGFFKPMQEWSRARGMDYMMHLNHEEIMLNRNVGESMIANEGSFFRAMRYCGVPGIDNLNQIGPGIVADFPKLAGSAAHLFGRPMAWTESGGSLAPGGKFIVDYQLVRGINSMNIRGINAAPAAGAAADPTAVTGAYVTRAQHLMTIGRPAAQVALFHPEDSFWLGDADADAVNVKLVTQLMEHQIDFDHIDPDSLASICTLEKDGIKNLSGQVYHAVIVGSSTVIQKSVLERLRAFAANGGKVIFVGRTPSMVVDKSFLHPEPGAPDLSFATLLEPTADITDKVVAALPKPDVKLDAACPPIKYMHRSLADGEVYFFFNESNVAQSRNVTLAGTGQVQVWDAATGKISAVAGARGQGSMSMPLALGSQESRFIVIGAMGGGQ